MAKRQRLDGKHRGGGLYFPPPRSIQFFNSGSELLNRALGGGWCERIVNVVGDNSSGKTLLACEGAANYLKKYPDRTVWYREVEAAFDDDYMNALGIPADKFDRGSDCYCVEDVFNELKVLTDKKRRGLYIVDSLDALSDRAEQKRNLDEGTYGANKAKMLSQLFRRLVQQLKKAEITVLVISQVRDKIGVVFGNRHSRSGGKALDFYASQILWLSQIKQIKRTVNGVERVVGITVRGKIKKNKVGPPLRECDFPILFNYGVEDVLGGMLWLKSVHGVQEAGFDSDDCKRLTSLVKLSKMDAAEYDAYRKRVVKGVRRVWNRVENDFAPTRKKY
jgi:recombination protein RecA